VVALGTDLDDCSVDGTPVRTKTAKVYRVESARNSRGAPGDLVLASDVGEFAKALTETWSSLGLRNTRANELVKSIKSATATFADTSNPDVLSPARALADLQATFGTDTRYVSDIGEHMLFALHYLTIEQGGAFSLHLPFGSMGSGICGALGEALANTAGEKPVVCICGDGGMQMNGMEVLVAAQLNLPIVFAVFNDARYGMVYHGFKHAYGREVPWETPWVDFVGWARSMNIPALRITQPGQLSPLMLARLGERKGPMVLDMRIERSMPFPMMSRNDALRRLSMNKPGEA
jgi:acetolactate synthase I/II/III large subunit